MIRKQFLLIAMLTMGFTTLSLNLAYADNNKVEEQKDRKVELVQEQTLERADIEQLLEINAKQAKMQEEGIKEETKVAKEEVKTEKKEQAVKEEAKEEKKEQAVKEETKEAKKEQEKEETKEEVAKKEKEEKTKEENSKEEKATEEVKVKEEKKEEKKQEKSAVEPSKADKLIEIAKSKLGRPYVYGSVGPSSFDCSGFTSYVFRQMGVSLPRVASSQAYSGKKIAKSDLQKGDLVFFNTAGGISHVGIYIENGNFIHASSYGRGVVVSNIYDSYYSPRYVTAARYI